MLDREQDLFVTVKFLVLKSLLVDIAATLAVIARRSEQPNMFSTWAHIYWAVDHLKSLSIANRQRTVCIGCWLMMTQEKSTDTYPSFVPYEAVMCASTCDMK